MSSRERERCDEDNDGAEIDYKKKIKMISKSMLGRACGGGGGTLNTTTPCAACKLLRRRCAQECPFSPYFSPHEPHKFASVHKVFGASNVSKMLMEVPESQRADAANSLVYEANVRLRDPVYGCMGAISALQHQLQSLQAELDLVRAEILRYKFREAAAASTSSISSSSSMIQVVLPPCSHQSSTITLLSSSSGVVVSAIAPSLPSPPPPPPSCTSASSDSTDFSTISKENTSYYG